MLHVQYVGLVAVLNFQVVSQPLQTIMDVVNLCAVINTLVDQDAIIVQTNPSVRR